MAQRSLEDVTAVSPRRRKQSRRYAFNTRDEMSDDPARPQRNR